MNISSMSSIYDISVFFFIIIIKDLRCSQALLETSKSFNMGFLFSYRDHFVYIIFLEGNLNY